MKDDYTKSDVYKTRIKRGMFSYLNKKPTDIRNYIRPGDGTKVRKVLSIFFNPLEYLKRWIAYLSFSTSQSTSVRMNNDGYAKFNVDDIKGGREFLNKICTFTENKRKQCNNNQFDSSNKYIIPQEEVINHPFILDFALNEDLIKIVSSYLKTIPVLYTVQLWHGGPNQVRAGVAPAFI